MFDGMVRHLASHGERVAVLTDERTLTYRELADETASVAAELGAERRLVLIETRNELDTLVAYLGALAAHHVVMPLPAGGNHETVIRTYAPDVILRNGSIAHRPGPGRRMHPELALLLSTVGQHRVAEAGAFVAGQPRRERRVHRSISRYQANRPGRNDIADVVLLRTVGDSQPSAPWCRTDPDGPLRRRRPVLGIVRPPARNAVTSASGLPGAAVRVVDVDALPLLSTGKPDYQAVRDAVRKAETAAPEPLELPALFADVLHLDPATIDPECSFVDLGGNSLS